MFTEAPAVNPSAHAVTQYAGTSKQLDARRGLLDYNTHSQGWYSWVGERISIKGDVLEVGAGTGELWRHNDASQARVVLTDFSPAMCEQLRQIPGVSSVVQCDAAKLPFPDASFDSVVAHHMLYHLDEPGAAIAEFARVLRPGGRLTVTLNGRTHLAELLDIGEEIGRPSVILGAARITGETGRESIEKHFVDVSEELFPGGFDVPQSEPVLSYLGTWGDEQMTEEQERKARAIIEAKIATDGSFWVTKKMIVFVGRRQ